MIEQVIGRGIRYKSHVTLPPKERYVNVYELLLVKPKKYMGIDNFLPKSVDDILFEFGLDKVNKNTEFIKNLKRVSIEKMNC